MIDIEEEIKTYSPEQLSILKEALEQDLEYHTRFFLRLREKQRFLQGRHHQIMFETMEAVHQGEINRLVINVPPSYTKTEICVVQFCSYCFANNPECRFLHISGGNTLARDNSSKIKDQMIHEVSRKLWGTSIRDDAKSKGLWKTNQNGSFYAVSAGGQIIGFRAGRSKPGFNGAIIIDDPQTPTDMLSDIKKEYFPNKYKDIIRHRVDNRNVPIIVVMQRIDEDDFSGWLLNGGSGEKWHHLCLPALIPHP